MIASYGYHETRDKQEIPSRDTNRRMTSKAAEKEKAIMLQPPITLFLLIFLALRCGTAHVRWNCILPALCTLSNLFRSQLRLLDLGGTRVGLLYTSVMKLNVRGLGGRCLTTFSASIRCSSLVLCCGLSNLGERSSRWCTRGGTSSGQPVTRSSVAIVVGVAVGRCPDWSAWLLSVLLARGAGTLVLLFVVLRCIASDEHADTGSFVVETRVEFAFRQLTDEIVNLSTLIALQGNGLDIAEIDRLSRILDIDG
jgi:hypothetical protein